MEILTLSDFEMVKNKTAESYFIVQDKYLLSKGYVFVPNYGLFLNKKLVHLTKKEFLIVSLLIENKNNVVTYEQIKKYVWNGKEYTRYTLRNLVLKIRAKTYEDFIVSHSNLGYILGEQKC